MEFYRSGGTGGEGKNGRAPVGIAFMMTHSFFDGALTGDYKTRTREYRDKEEPLMSVCREKVGASVEDRACGLMGKKYLNIL